MAEKAFYTAWAEVAPDFSKFGREVDKGFRDTLAPAGVKGGQEAGEGVKSGMLASVRSLAGPLVAAVAGLGLGAAIGSTIRDGIMQANDLDQTVSAIRTVFGDASESVEEFAQTAVRELGISQQQALEASQMFGVFGKAAGLTGDDLSGFSNDLAGLGADLAAFYGGDIQTALDAISAGLRGESEPLRQFGVLLDDATLKQRAMEMGLYDGTGALTQQQRVLAAQAEILAQTADAQGQATREGETFDGQLKRLQAGWESIVTTIGQLFLPIVTEVVSFLNQEVIPVLSEIITAIRDGDWGSVFDIFNDLRNTIVTGLLEALPDVIQGFTEFLPTLVSTVVGMLPKVIAALLGMLPTLLTAAVTLFMALVDGLVVAIPQVLTALLGMLPDLLMTIIGMLPELLSTAITLFLSLVQAIAEALPQIISALLGILPELVTTLIEMIPELIPAAIQLFLGLVTGLIEAIPDLIDSIIFDMIPAIVQAIIDSVPALIDAGKQLIQGLIDGVTSMFGNIGDAFGGVMDFIGGFFPHSPAKRGPFSGAGWRQLGESGGALYDQFMSGFGGDDPEFPDIRTGVRVPRPAPLDDLGGSSLASSGAGVTQNIYAQPNMSEETVGDISARRLAFELRGA